MLLSITDASSKGQHLICKSRGGIAVRARRRLSAAGTRQRGRGAHCVERRRGIIHATTNTAGRG